MKVSSCERWRATAAERRAHGGQTVTKYIAQPTVNSTSWFYVVSYAPTPAERTSLARAVALILYTQGRVKPGECVTATPGILASLKVKSPPTQLTIPGNKLDD